MIKLSKLNRLYIIKNIVYFEGKLYERLYNHPRRHKFRVIITDDDYDYVTDRNLQRRLTRAINSAS